jgi:hypothetical protein
MARASGSTGRRTEGMTEKLKYAETLPSGTKPTLPPPGQVPHHAAATLDLGDDPSFDETMSVDLVDAVVSAITPDQPGYVVAHRYRLLEVIGRGAHGRVWAAEDQLTGGHVALKMLSPDFGAMSARIRREVASMRLLRLSGVVQLLDEGTDGDRPFLVMERVHGTPFPGCAVPASWEQLAGPAVALLETLSRMHAVGIVHRDLKPANVLVDAAGRPIILDFGLARVDTSLDEGITDHGSILGTPAYLSPEQIESHPVTARSDLYSVGVMLFEVLSGRFPHPLENVMRMLRARLSDPPTPLRDVAPAVPVAIAAVIDALLARDPAGRPRSAGEVLDRLRGQKAVARPALRRLGGDAPVRALVDAALAGRSLDVYGPRGSGRTRCLDDVAAELGQAGRAVVRVGPGARGGDAEAFAEGLRAALAAGEVVLADDADRLEPALAAALTRLRGAGSVLRALTGAPPPAGPAVTGAPPPAGPAVTLGPLAEAELRPLFVGASRLFHLPEDAARVLHRRTDGMPARVADDVTGWIQAGIARWDGDRVSVDRDAIERLEAGLIITPLGPLPQPSAPLPAELDDLLGWIVIAHPHADTASLALARGVTWLQMAADLEALQGRGAVRVLADGRVEPLCAPGDIDSWTPERRREVHRRIAFAAPPGTPRRLYHLITGTDDDVELGTEITAEARHLGRRLAMEGRLALASAAVSEGLRAERKLGMSGAVESLPLLSLAVEIALEDGTARMLDRALYELYRVRPRSNSIERLAQLVKAALAVLQRTPLAMAQATDLGPFLDPYLERHRQELRVVASRQLSPGEQEALLEEMRIWAEGSTESSARAAYGAWLARLRYRQGRFVEAAELNTLAAAGERSTTARLAALLSCATSRMEAFQLDEATHVAHEALTTARHHRLLFAEARAERILRSIAYRAGTATEPDLELVEAARNLGVGDWEAMLSLNEAAIAFRNGAELVARDLARRAEHAWTAMGEVSGGALLAASLALACGADSSTEEVERLVERALSCPVASVGLQTLGLVARSGRGPALDQDRLAGVIAILPQGRWNERREVLSLREALDALSDSRRRGTPP